MGERKSSIFSEKGVLTTNPVSLDCEELYEFDVTTETPISCPEGALLPSVSVQTYCAQVTVGGGVGVWGRKGGWGQIADNICPILSNLQWHH